MVGRQPAEIQVGGAIRENLSRFTERFWEPPREARNLFPIYRQFLHYELSSHIYTVSFRSPGQRRLSPCAGKISSPGEIWQTMPTNFSPLTFDLLVTNGHSSEQVSVWDDGQPDDCVCETFCAFVLSRGRVQPCSHPIIALFLSHQTFLFVDDTKTLHPHFSWLSASFGG